MARNRHNTKVKSSARRTRRQIFARISHTEKLAFVSKHYSGIDPTNRKQVARKYRALRLAPLDLQRPAPKPVLAELKKRGFFVTKKGVVVDGPRDVHGQKLKGAKTRINKDGTVVTTFKQRRDYVVGFTAAEKKEFAKNPRAFRDKKMKELRRTYPKLREAKDVRIRLQWGAYAAKKEFAPNYFTKEYFQLIGKNDQKKIEPLVGFHIVAHYAKPRKGKRKKKRR